MKTTFHSFALCILLLFVQSAHGKGTQSIRFIMDNLPVGDSIFVGQDHLILGTDNSDTFQLEVAAHKDLLLRRGNSSLYVPKEFLPIGGFIRVMKAMYNKPPSGFYIRIEGISNQPWVKTTRGKVWMTILMESKLDAAKVDSVVITFTGGTYSGCKQILYGRNEILIDGWEFDPSTDVFGETKQKILGSKTQIKFSTDDSNIVVPVGIQYRYLEISVGNERTGISVYWMYRNEGSFYE